jgi:hypothetical protein
MSDERFYLRWLFASTTALLAAAAVWNLVVDPYSVFDVVRIDRFNANKPAFVEQLRMTHVYAVERRKPRCVLLGTSRTGRGLDPAHPALSGLDCYNMALPSINLYEMRRYFQHAQAIRPLETVILALDLRVFGAAPDASSAFLESRLAVDRDGHPQFNLFSAKLPDLADALVSMPAIYSSMKTVRRQAWIKETLARNGHWARLEGRYEHGAAFMAFTRNTLGRYAEMQNRDAVFRRNSEELRNLLEAAYASGARVTIIISPSHAWHWQALEQSGLWARFEDLKHDIVNVNEDEASRANRSAFPVWDFSGAYGPNLESPPTSAGATMRWYWEPVHYTRELGNWMLDRIARDSPPSDWPDFGTRLTPGNLEGHLARLRHLQRTYADEHPDVVATIRSLMREAN